MKTIYVGLLTLVLISAAAVAQAAESQSVRDRRKDADRPQAASKDDAQNHQHDAEHHQHDAEHQRGEADKADKKSDKKNASKMKEATKSKDPSKANRSSEQRDISGGGRVLRTKKVAVGDTDIEHLVALLKTRSGNRRIVDLGPTSNFRDAPVHSGDMLSVRGRVVSVGDRQVFMANQATVNGKSIDIERKMSGREAGRRLSEKGKIFETRTMRERQSGADHILAVVETRSGKRLVDLGPASRLRDIKFVKGDALSVSGRVVDAGGRKLWIADQLRIHGEAISLSDIRSQQADAEKKSGRNEDREASDQRQRR